MKIRRASSTLKTEYFPVLEREETLGISVLYTETLPDPRIDAAFLDEVDATRYFFGISYHYVVLTNGRIEVGRDPRTRTSIGKAATRDANIFIGVVGGRNDDGRTASTFNLAQRYSVDWLMQKLADTLQHPLEVTDTVESRYLRDQLRQQEDAERAEEEALDRSEA